MDLEYFYPSPTSVGRDLDCLRPSTRPLTTIVLPTTQIPALEVPLPTSTPMPQRLIPFDSDLATSSPEGKVTILVLLVHHEMWGGLNQCGSGCQILIQKNLKK